MDRKIYFICRIDKLGGGSYIILADTKNSPFRKKLAGKMYCIVIQQIV